MNTKCTITIQEIDGKLSIIANIPEEKSVAAELAKRLVDLAQDIMNEVLGETQRVEKVVTQ